MRDRTVRIGGWNVRLEPLILTAIFLAGFAFLYNNLDYATILVFDESHYVGVARHHLNGEWIDPQWGQDSPRPYNFEHPPLAKFLITASIWAIGDEPTGWRTPSVLFGAAGYVAAYMLARNVFRSRVAGGAAAAFLALDPMYYVHARMAVLEVFPTVLTTFSLAYVTHPDGPKHTTSGIFLGLAVACKYSALFFGPAIALIALVRMRADWRDRTRTILLRYFLIPGAIFVSANALWIYIWIRDYGLIFALDFFFWIQYESLGYGYAADLTHDYVSHPATWFLLFVPMAYYWNIPAGGLTQGWLYAIGNPASWWPAVVAALYRLPIMASERSRGARRLGGLDTLAVALVLSFAPFFLVRRITLIFYVTAYTPLLAAIAAGLFWYMWRHHDGRRALAVAYAVLVAAAWIVYYPVATATQVPTEQIFWIFDLIPWMERLPVQGVYDG